MRREFLSAAARFFRFLLELFFPSLGHPSCGASFFQAKTSSVRTHTRLHDEGREFRRRVRGDSSSGGLAPGVTSGGLRTPGFRPFRPSVAFELPLMLVDITGSVASSRLRRQQRQRPIAAATNSRMGGEERRRNDAYVVDGHRVSVCNARHGGYGGGGGGPGLAADAHPRECGDRAG